MRNTIVIDTDILATQQRAVNESNVAEPVKEGLNELFSAIRDMAEDFHQDAPVTFVMVLHKERLER